MSSGRHFPVFVAYVVRVLSSSTADIPIYQVMKLREHEQGWAETTAREISLRRELCGLRDGHASATADATALRKRCEALERENKELGER